MKNLIGVIILMFVFSPVMAQSEMTSAPAKKVDIAHIQTSAICGACKKRIEKELNYTKGVVFSELDMETKIVKVKFKTKVLNEDGIKRVISNLGYKAGDVEPNKEAYNNLPGCCQKPGLCND